MKVSWIWATKRAVIQYTDRYRKYMFVGGVLSGKIVPQKSEGIKEQHILPPANSHQQAVTQLSKPCAPFTNYYKNLFICHMLSCVVNTDGWK